MDHILARIKGAKIEEVKAMLKADASKHAERGLVLRHIWRNTDDRDEVLFIFTTADLDRARKFMETVQADTLRENPNANLPQLLFLKGE
ncbi:MAG: hypothetical protein M3261_07465 [Thermoproteota archaeon]|nr:hypothetical protein [Thermoproteota archaeon]